MTREIKAEVLSCGRCDAFGMRARTCEYWLTHGPSALTWDALVKAEECLHDAWQRLQRRVFHPPQDVASALCILRSRGMFRFQALMCGVVEHSGVGLIGVYDADDPGCLVWFQKLCAYWSAHWISWVTSLERDGVTGEARVNLDKAEIPLPSPRTFVEQKLLCTALFASSWIPSIEWIRCVDV